MIEAVTHRDYLVSPLVPQAVICVTRKQSNHSMNGKWNYLGWKRGSFNIHRKNISDVIRNDWRSKIIIEEVGWMIQVVYKKCLIFCINTKINFYIDLS